MDSAGVATASSVMKEIRLRSILFDLAKASGVAAASAPRKVLRNITVQGIISSHLAVHPVEVVLAAVHYRQRKHLRNLAGMGLAQSRGQLVEERPGRLDYQHPLHVLL